MATRQVFELSTSERRKRIFSEEFKKQKVQELERKQTTIAEISKAYQVRYNSVSKWVEKYGLNHQKGVRLVVEMESETKKILPARTKEPLFVPDAVNKIWSMDFMSDALSNGRKIRVFNVMDDYNREALAIEASSSIPSVSVINILKDVIDWRGKPEQIRVDNGPEFTSGSFAHWCKEENIKLQYIQPGKPMQNGFIERFNRTYREEILDAYIFEDLGQIRELSQNWMEDYNKLRPHESLKGNSPEKFKRLREFVDSGKLG